MALKYLGAVTITAATPKLLTTALPTMKAEKGHALIIAQKRGNTGFVYIGDEDMTGESNASITIPPASASQTPFYRHVFEDAPNGATIQGIKIDGSANEVVQISLEVL